MPIYRKPQLNIIPPTVTSVYSHRTSRTDLAKNIYEKNKNYSLSYKKNYGDRYDFPVNYPSINTMQASVGTIGTNLGTIPF